MKVFKMALEKTVKEFAVACRIDSKAEDWLIAEKILDVEGVASLSPSEALVEVKIINVMVAAGATELKKSGAQVAITKFWRKCREAFEHEQAMNAATLAAALPVPGKLPIPHSTD